MGRQKEEKKLFGNKQETVKSVMNSKTKTATFEVDALRYLV